jgi:predicted lactoylglutathione lyase
MKLGAFSVSLAVKDIHASREFYSKLGFVDSGGDIDQNWLIMKNGDHIIGLFQGMFEDNILTFNPGWDQNASNLETFTDVRERYKELKENGALSGADVEFSEQGPGSFTFKDPDGNSILIDQHR